ncbi:MAG: hypothetical protein A2Y74_08825 [Actinobacteria bacterium RBG_13_63_9]|nr:MAG: hypothetical protein A2Y74_08825 [Actinobacteria bacterium RBG_13_63_9]
MRTVDHEEIPGAYQKGSGMREEDLHPLKTSAIFGGRDVRRQKVGRPFIGQHLTQHLGPDAGPRTGGISSFGPPQHS